MTGESPLPWLIAHEKRLWLGLALVFVLVFSFHTMGVFLYGSDLLGLQQRSFVQMMLGTGVKPHVYRQLLPALTNAIVALSPAALMDPLVMFAHDWLREPGGFLMEILHKRRRLLMPELEDEHLYALVVMLGLDYAALLGSVFYTWRVAQVIFPGRFYAQMLAPCLAVIAVEPFCVYFAWFYDFPVLFFSAWLTYVLVRGRLMLFTLGVALATLNKETSFFMIGLFLMYGWREFQREVMWRHFAAQCGLYVVMKGGIGWYYAQNTGRFLWWDSVYSNFMFGAHGYDAASFMGVLAGVALVGYRWREKPYVLQCWTVIMPFSVMSWVIFGLGTEYRVMYEIFPAAVLMACDSLARAQRILAK